MNIRIKDTDIELKNKIRAILIYEQMTGKTFNLQTTTDFMLYMYSVILANKPDLELTFEELIDIIEDDESKFKQFTNWLAGVTEKNQHFTDQDKTVKKKSKSK